MTDTCYLCVQSTTCGEMSVRVLWRPVANTEASGAGVGSEVKPVLGGEDC